MKITKLILEGYKPLVLNNVHRFEYTPSMMYQLILGTNGSGKSSVLAELGPMPGVAANYIKGGRKEIHIEHRGVEYILISEFKSGNKHTFKKGEDFLQESGTGSVQKELVKQEFGLTQDLQDLMTGLIKFTDLTPLKRRDWLTMLCETDYTYALQVHQKLKSGLRDNQGALKHVNQRITAESNKLLTLDAGDELEEHYKQLHAELDVLFQERNPNLQQSGDYQRRCEELLAYIEELSAAILNNPLPTVPTGKSYRSLDDVDADLNHLQTERKVLTARRESVSQELQELEKLLEGIRSSGVEDIEGLKKRLVERHQRLEEVKGSIELFTIEHAPQDTLTAYHQAYGPLTEILYNLPDNTDRRFNKETLTRSREQLSELRIQQERLINRRSRVEGQLEHYHQAKSNQCPECGYTWVPGVSEHDVAKAEETLKGLKQELEQLGEKIQGLQSYVDQAEEYIHHYRGVRELHQQYPLLKVLWDYLLESKAYTNNPSGWINRLPVFQRDAERSVELQKLDKECQELTSLIEGSGNQSDTQGFSNRISVLHDNIEKTTQQLEVLGTEIADLQQYRTQVSRQLGLYDKMVPALNELSKVRDTLLEAYRNDEIKSVTAVHQNTLATLQRKRTEKQTLEGVVSDLQVSKGDLEGDQAVLEALVNTLSPTDGLIAEQLSGFIEGFVTHLNQIIDGIWTYDLAIRPCGLNDGDLDYRFPLEIKGENNPVPDIAKGSTAQVEVVNLAFKLVAMMYLQLEDYPLYLDEIGASFDEQHRINVMNVLKTLVDTGGNTQMFMISHYAGQYGSFPQAETLVLDASNIAVPGEYNKHVIME